MEQSQAEVLAAAAQRQHGRYTWSGLADWCPSMPCRRKCWTRRRAKDRVADAEVAAAQQRVNAQEAAVKQAQAAVAAAESGLHQAESAVVGTAG